MHKKQWEFLKNKFEQGQLSHAYLFSGQKGLGKKDFAEKFAEFIGCKFPDFKIIEKKEDKSEIEILQIREVQDFLLYKSYNGGFKVVIIDGAEKMNQEAQNCFLKTLEEPKGKTVLILVTSKPEMLLPTIFSRCQIIKFFGNPTYSQQKIEEENRLLNEILKAAKNNLSEKFKYTKSLDFEKQNVTEIIEVLQKYLRDQFLKKIETAEAIKIKKKLELTEEILSKLIFTNANPKLALEILLMDI